MAKHYIFSVLISALVLMSAPVLAEKLLPDAECVNHCVLHGFSRDECHEQCPKFAYRGNYLRDTKRYYTYRNCVQQCMMKQEDNHYYLCATQRCRVRE